MNSPRPSAASISVSISGSTSIWERQSSQGRRVCAWIVLLAALGAATPSLAVENALPNGDFKSDVNGWTTAISDGSRDISLTWSALDANASASSGSGAVANRSSASSAIGTAPLLANTCIALPEGALVSYGADILIPSGQAQTGFARVQVLFYSDPSCVFISSYAPTDNLDATGAWTLTGIADVDPLGAKSARVGLAVTKQESGGELTAHFDNVFVSVPEPGSAARAFAAIGALIALARRRGSRARAQSA